MMRRRNRRRRRGNSSRFLRVRLQLELFFLLVVEQGEGVSGLGEVIGSGKVPAPVPVQALPVKDQIQPVLSGADRVFADPRVNGLDSQDCGSDRLPVFGSQLFSAGRTAQSKGRPSTSAPFMAIEKVPGRENKKFI